MTTLRRILCRLLGHKFAQVRFRIARTVQLLEQGESLVVIEHTFGCVRCGVTGYREQLTMKCEVIPGLLTTYRPEGPAKWTGLS